MLEIINRTVWRTLSLAVIYFVLPTQVFASFHQDIEVSRVGSTLQAGFCMNPAHGCDIVGVEHLGLPPNTLPTDFATGKDIYVTAFTHIKTFGLYETNNPGFQSVAGALAGEERVYYKALGVMEFWNPVTGAWDIAPDNVQIRLAGGLQPVAVQSCGGLFWCPPKLTYEESFTIYSGKGVSGAESLIIGRAAANGSFHSHLDWFLEETPGTDDGVNVGAYLVEMSLFSDKRPELSDSFYILFNNQLDVDVKTGEDMSEFQRAMSMRVLGPSLAEVPIPAAFFLFLGALGLMSGGRLLRLS